MDMSLSPLKDYIEQDGALIHRLANLVGNVTIGEGSRIDAFVTITGNVTIGHHTHIANGVAIFGGGGVSVGNYVGLSGGVKVYSTTEDVSGEWITNPTVPARFRNPDTRPIRIGDHVVMGAGSIAFPGADLPDGAYLGALSMCRHPLAEWSINAGIPATFKRYRSRKALELAAQFEREAL